jgi:hypothetical protein
MRKILLINVVAFLLAALPAYAVETEVPLNEGDRQAGQEKVWTFLDVGFDHEAVLEMPEKIAKSGSGGGQGRGRARGRGSDDGIFDDRGGRGRGSDDPR